MNHAPRSRPRERPLGDEMAGNALDLGEFNNSTALSLSETRTIVNAVIQHRANAGVKVQETENLTKTRDWLDTFARFKDKASIEAVEALLAEHPELAPFERAQLGSLCCGTAEETKALIPSLAEKISDDDLQALLNDILRFQNIED